MEKLSQMRIQIDTHTHTVLSGHAWSTIQENAAAAKEIGLKAICSTEHSYQMPQSTPFFFPHSLRFLPPSMSGVTLIPGMEFNIMDYEGHIDVVSERYLKPILFAIASMHDVCLNPGTVDEQTQSYCAVLRNPYIDILGHPGSRNYPCDIETVVRAAKEHNKMIEINNNSFTMRKGSTKNCIEFAKMCKRHDVRVCVSSDAHIASRVGVVDQALKLLEEVDFPPELILNLSMERFEKYLHERKDRILAITPKKR